MKNWKTSAEQILTSGPVVPVIVINKLEHAVPLAKALVAGGVRVLEVTLRTACAVEANGGVKALQAIAGPFPQVRFCPTGGITPNNYRDYLALKSVLCIGGSWLVPADALESGDYARITKLAQEAVAGAKQ